MMTNGAGKPFSSQLAQHVFKIFATHETMHPASPGDHSESRNDSERLK
jgi:hypothetical protein